MFIVEVVDYNSLSIAYAYEWSILNVIDTTDFVQEEYFADRIMPFIREHSSEFCNITLKDSRLFDVYNDNIIVKRDDLIIVKYTDRLICVRNDDYLIDVRVVDDFTVEVNGVEKCKCEEKLALSFPYKPLYTEHLCIDASYYEPSNDVCDYFKTIKLKDFVYKAGSFSKIKRKVLMR